MALTNKEKKVLDYALCYLAANVDDKAIEDLNLTEQGIHVQIVKLKKEFGLNTEN